MSRMNTTALYWPLFIDGEMFLGKLYVFSRSIENSITLFHQYIRDNMICIVHKFISKTHCSYPIICNEDEPSFCTLSLFCTHNTVVSHINSICKLHRGQLNPFLYELSAHISMSKEKAAKVAIDSSKQHH